MEKEVFLGVWRVSGTIQLSNWWRPRQVLDPFHLHWVSHQERREQFEEGRRGAGWLKRFREQEEITRGR